MTVLKPDTLDHHLKFIFNDFKRIIFFLLVTLVFFIFNQDVGFLLGRTITSQPNVLWLTIPALSIFIVSFIIQLKSSQLPDYRPHLLASFLFTFHLIFLNALSEELFFRGLIQNLIISGTNSSLLAILLSAALFGYYHIPMFKWDKSKAFLAFLAGIFFGCVYFYSGSIFSVWFAHAAADLGLVHEGLIGYLVWTRLRYKEIS